jgi:hypothetical protein
LIVLSRARIKIGYFWVGKNLIKGPLQPVNLSNTRKPIRNSLFGLSILKPGSEKIKPGIGCFAEYTLWINLGNCWQRK